MADSSNNDGPLDAQHSPSNDNNTSLDEVRLLFPRFEPCRHVPRVTVPPEQKWRENERIQSTYSLLPSNRSIRLIHLQPGKKDEPISCRLVITQLDDKPQYEAVSYVWGDTYEHAEISVDGTPFKVTRNLYGALKRTREEASGRGRTLWVDAICIDQGNLAERSAQVQMMRDIYRQASRVLVWLGPGDMGDEVAMGLINRLASDGDTTAGFTQDVWKLGAHKSEHRVNSSVREKKRALAPSWALLHDWPKKPDAALPVDRIRTVMNALRKKREGALPVDRNEGGEWDALFRFFELPYFCRTWVIQEIQSNTNHLVLCGDAETSFESIEITAQTAFRSPKFIQEKMVTDRGISNALYIRSLAATGTGLLARLEQTRGFFATDPRDKIFAFLRPGDSVIPDYGKSMVSVFMDATRQMLGEDGLDVLSLVFHKSSYQMRDGAMPSWVPTFSEPFFVPLHKVRGLAAGGHELDDPAWAVEDKMLKARTIFVDRITTVYPVMHWDNFSIPPSQKGLPTFLDRLWHLYASEDKARAEYPLGSCSTRQAFAATLTAGLGRWGLKPNIEDHDKAFTEFTEQLFGSAPTISDRLEDERAQWEERCCTNLPDWVEDEITYINYNGGTESVFEPDGSLHGNDGTDGGQAHATNYQLFQRAAQSVCNNRCIFRTAKGYLGLGPSVMSNSLWNSWDEAKGAYVEQHLDKDNPDEAYEVRVLLGAKTPFVLLPQGSAYVLAGECYVHGLMNGEALADGVTTAEEIELI